ncbi:hypothetical protein BDN67DRAFT_150716 [Paxillus ammoniavirescens]|nr:hypothetical protein BDN67DRAFT_150716 [Paxillus ammoniavirescens]
MSSHSMHRSQDHPYHTENHSSQKQRQSKVERIRNALAIVRDGKIEPDFGPLRERIRSIPHDDNSPSELYQLFDLIFNDSRGGPLFRRWIEDQAVDVVQRKVYDAMDDVKDALRGIINLITPEFLMTWDINSTMDRIVDESAPTLGIQRRHLLPYAYPYLDCCSLTAMELSCSYPGVYCDCRTTRQPLAAITSQPLLSGVIHDHTR